MMVAHYSKVLVSLYTKDLCHSPPLPFQTEKRRKPHFYDSRLSLHNLFSILLFLIPISVKYLLQYLHLQSD